jgi:hypothetical protein
MDPPSTPSMTVLFCRILWSLLGPLFLLFAAAVIVQSGGGWFTSHDLLFAVILLATILCRCADYRYGKRTNSAGEPVAILDLRHYTFAWALAGGAVWVIANLIGNHAMQ